MFGIPYAEQTPEQRLQFTDAHGKAEPRGERAVEVARVTRDLTAQQEGSDGKLAAREMTRPQWRDDYGDRKENLRFYKDQVYANAGTTPGHSPVLDAYYKAIDDSIGADGKPDWDRLDKYIAGLDGPDQKYIAEHTGFLQLDTPTTRKFEAARDNIDASGYFERNDANFTTIKNILGLPHETYEEWRNSERKRLQGILGDSATQAYADAEIESAIAKSEIGKAMEELGSQWKEQWVIENPEAAYQAWYWGYYTPTKDVKEYLNRRFAGREP
jgi:hypothetical protein